MSGIPGTKIKNRAVGFFLFFKKRVNEKCGFDGSLDVVDVLPVVEYRLEPQSRSGDKLLRN